MRRKPNEVGLKCWSLRSPTKGWDRMVVFAYSMKDAIQIYIEAGGYQRGAEREFRDFSGLGGADFHKLVPNPTRGAYFVDRFCKAVQYVEPKKRTIVDDVPEKAQAAAAAAPPPEEYGRLHTGFKRGVKIDEWTYHSPFYDRAHADAMKAEVRMENVSRRRRIVDGDGIVFVATSNCFERIESPNIETLFGKVNEAFKTFDLARRGIVWEDWLEVEIAPANVYSSTASAGFAVGYRKLKRGSDPRNGNVYTLNDNSSVIPFPKPKAAGEKRTRKVGHMDLDDREVSHQYTYLPATEKNIAALDAVMQAINNARAKLEMILVQEKIQNTLAAIPAVPLLEEKARM